MTNTQHAKKSTLGILWGVLCLLTITSAVAQTPPPPPASATKPPATVTAKKIDSKKTETKTTPVTTIAPVIVAAPVAEFSHEQKLLIENAEKLDALNRELLVRNQQLQLTNEKLSLQAEMFKHDRYSEGTRDTLVTILLGILVGWFLSKTKKRARYRDF
ncbi:MAG: hypothetical protein KBF23_02645 [Agitococcus sp.]|nr:hypothetical protein [Agitococcus sp.]